MRAWPSARLPSSARGPRAYLLATLSKGLDIREADEVTAVGVAAGVDFTPSHLFAEFRYEYASQPASPRHAILPVHQLTLCAGLRIGRSSPATDHH